MKKRQTFPSKRIEYNTVNLGVKKKEQNCLQGHLEKKKSYKTAKWQNAAQCFLRQESKKKEEEEKVPWKDDEKNRKRGKCEMSVDQLRVVGKKKG